MRKCKSETETGPRSPIADGEDTPFSPHGSVLQGAIVVLARGFLLSQPCLDLGHGVLLEKLIDYITSVHGVAIPENWAISTNSV